MTWLHDCWSIIQFGPVLLCLSRVVVICGWALSEEPDHSAYELRNKCALFAIALPLCMSVCGAVKPEALPF